MDKNTACSIKIVGEYSNFEAEFDRFNEIYPNVDLTYTKLDDYNNEALPKPWTVVNDRQIPNNPTELFKEQ